MIKRGLQIGLFILSFIALTSCTVKLSYGFLDNLMSWKLGQYVKLDAEQKKFAKTAIDDFHRWHRETQLCSYATYLESLRDGMLAGPVTAEYLHIESNKLQDMIDVSMEKLLPDLTKLAATFSEQQIAQVVSELKKNREEYRDDYVDADSKHIQKERIKDITRYIGGFFGRFSDQQKQRLIEWEESLSPHEELMLKQQEQWQADFLTAMQYQDKPDELQARLRNLMLYRTDNWDKELQQRLDINQDLTFAMLADLFNSQSDKQKDKLRRKFDQYISDLNDLASK